MSLELKSNSRQIPKNKEIMISAQYCDILYAYLQVISSMNYEKTQKPRRITKKQMNWTKIGAAIGMTRQTVKSKIDKLESLGLLTELDNGDYELAVLPRDLAELIPQKTLEILTVATNKNVINIFIYLSTRFRANGYKPFRFTYEQIKLAIGLSASSHDNNFIIQSILLVLSKLELISFEEFSKTNEEGQFETFHLLMNMNNEISDETFQRSGLKKRV